VRRRTRLAAGLTLCVAALAVGGMGAAQFRLAFSRGPLLVDPHGLAIDEEGRIYVGVAGIQLHVYGPDGTLVNAWSVDAEGAPLRLELLPGAVVVASSERVFVFGRDGAARETRSDPDVFERIGPDRNRRVEASGAAYRVEGMTLVREKPGPEQVLVAEPPWPLRALPHRPLVFALLLLGGAGGLMVLPFLLGVVARARPDDDG
jgi:hypothetical protein